jgi:hypothetical protein
VAGTATWRSSGGKKEKLKTVVASDPTAGAGIDMETIKKSLQAVSSSSLPVTPPATTTQEPSASSTESFRSMYSGV